MTVDGEAPALKPCAFCGSRDGAFIERADFSSAYVICNDCGARGPTSCDENEADARASEAGGCEPGELAARRLWNRRTAPPVWENPDLADAMEGLSFALRFDPPNGEWSHRLNLRDAQAIYSALGADEPEGKGMGDGRR